MLGWVQVLHESRPWVDAGPGKLLVHEGAATAVAKAGWRTGGCTPGQCQILGGRRSWVRPGPGGAEWVRVLLEPVPGWLCDPSGVRSRVSVRPERCRCQANPLTS